MAGTIQSNKDKEMAARLKREGVKRIKARCPICHKVVNVNGLYNHIWTCSK